MNKYSKDRLTFQEVIELESAVPGMYYRRCDYPAKWCFRFDHDLGGKLIQYRDGSESPATADWYHHDFMDGVFKISKPKSALV